MFISKHKAFREEYCASIVQIGELFPIEGKDKIAKTIVNGLSIVVNKDDIKTGDVVIYCSNESQLNSRFLYENSMYQESSKNKDTDKRGYISNNGRIRAIKLGGVYSFGILLSAKTIANYIHESELSVLSYLNDHLGEDFDMINDDLFVKVYIPPIKTQRVSTQKGEKKPKPSCLIDGSYIFHYDTSPLYKNMRDINPDDVVFISKKLHGTLGQFANIPVKKHTNIFKRLYRRLFGKEEYDMEYKLIYSSHHVIKNGFINTKNINYYSTDIWGEWAKKLDGLIPKDYCIYGEIIGFQSDGKYIQKDYDYGCFTNQSKLMVYRIVNNGKELDIPEVIEFGKSLKEQLPHDILDYQILYHGTLQSLYPDIPIDDNWHDSVLDKLRNENLFGMERQELLCKNKVPTEGIVLRIHKDVLKRAYKLKCNKFWDRERKAIDVGEVDIEMQN